MSMFSATSKRSKSTSAATACDGKFGFSGFTQAAAVINRNTTKERPARSVYHCGHCQLWHVGTDKGRFEKKRAADFKERKYHE